MCWYLSIASMRRFLRWKNVILILISYRWRATRALMMALWVEKEVEICWLSEMIEATWWRIDMWKKKWDNSSRADRVIVELWRSSKVALTRTLASVIISTTTASVAAFVAGFNPYHHPQNYVCTRGVQSSFRKLSILRFRKIRKLFLII